MKSLFPRLAESLLLIFILTACSLPVGVAPTADPGIVATIAAATLAAFTQAAEQTQLTTPSSTTTLQPTNTGTPTPVLSATIRPTISPTFTPTPTQTKGATNTPVPDPGTIAGSISGYPYGSIPALAIVAFGQEPPYRYSYLITSAGETYFSMTTPYTLPGNYQVVAYDSSGHAGGCAGLVQVISNETVNCTISNWGEGYPSKPASVPNP